MYDDQNALRLFTLKTVLARSQTEMGSVVLDTGGKAVLALKRQRTWLSRVLVSGGR